MKTLRLLFTAKCNRNCLGCVNKDWNLQNLPKINSFDFDEIIITGGEPLLFPEQLIGYIKAIRAISKAKIYVYTAMTVVNGTFKPFYDILPYVDGVTLTLHNQKDADNFKHVLYSMEYDNWPKDYIENKSFRLNVFKGIELPINFRAFYKWKVKKDIIWIKDCPLPENEVFMQI